MRVLSIALAAMPFLLSAQVDYTDPNVTMKSGADSTEALGYELMEKAGIDVQEIDVTFKSGDGDVEMKGTVVDGDLLVEGDIVVGPADELGIGVTTKAVVIDNVKFLWWTVKNYRWSKGVMPYYLPSNHPKRSTIISAINKINKETVLKLVPRRKQKDYVYFQYSGSNGPASSPVGKRGGKQTVKIPGWASRGTVIHEIFHSAGMFHEQSRCDRNKYVTVHYNNIKSGKSHNFKKHCSGATDIGSYNYNSIMHYGRYGFSKNGKATLVPKKNVYIGQRSYISYGDRYALNRIY